MNSEQHMQNEQFKKLRKTKFLGFFYGSGASMFIFLLIAMGMVGCPRWRVYNQEMKGKAEIARARENREITVEEARAKREAAIYLAQADSIRAEGTATANKIIAESITEEYLKWMFIDQLEDIDDQVIYLPTEAGIPMLEAGKR